MPRLRRFRVLAVVLGPIAWVACDPSVGDSATPTPTPTPTPQAVAAAAEPGAPRSGPASKPESKPANRPPVGWWRSETVCLELFGNGDFELAVLGPGPKTLIMGTSSLTAAAAESFTVDLAVQRIWRARFTGPCRRTHQIGGWIESEQALSSSFTPNATTSLKLTQLSQARIELCGTTCATLERDTPTLGGHFRRAGLDDPSRPTVPFAAGDVLEIVIDDVGSHVWLAKDTTSWDTPRGTSAVASLGDDRFTVTLTRTDEAGKTLAFTARRLPGERLELCTETERCATLERTFDAYDHDVR